MRQADETRMLLAAAVATVLLAGSAALGSTALLGAVALVQAALILTWALTGAPPAPVVGHAVADPAGGGSAGGPATEPPANNRTGVPGLILGASVAGVPLDEMARAGDRLDADLEFTRPVGPALPGRIGALVIGALAAAGADSAVSVWPHSALSPVLAVLGLAVAVMFVHQLVRGVVRSRVVESLSGIAVLVVCVVALTALMQLRHEQDGGRMTVAAVTAIGLALVVAALCDLLWSRPRYDPDVPRGLTATVLGTVLGTAAGAVILRPLGQFGPVRATLLCGAAAGSAALAWAAVGFLAHGLTGSPAGPRARALRPVAIGIIPLALVAPAAYVLLLNA